MNWTAIVWAGFLATVAAMAVFWVFRSLGWTIFSPAVQTGGIFFRNPYSPATETVGLVLLFLLGSTLLPAAYAWIMGAAASVSWTTGAALGALHGALTSALLPLLGMISASVRDGPLPEPGRFGLGWGRITPLAIVLGHTMYGGVLGAVLAGF